MLEATLIFLALILARAFTSEKAYQKMIRDEIEEGLRDGSSEAKMRRGRNER